MTDNHYYCTQATACHVLSKRWDIPEYQELADKYLAIARLLAEAEEIEARIEQHPNNQKLKDSIQR